MNINLLVLLALSALGTACAPAPTRIPHPEPAVDTPAVSEQKRQAFIERIMALPEGLVHEDSPASFRKQLEKGDWFSTNGNVSLGIDGDGTFGRRVFFGLADGTLKVRMMKLDDGPLRREYYRYNEATQSLELERVVNITDDGYEWDSDVSPRLD